MFGVSYVLCNAAIDSSPRLPPRPRRTITRGKGKGRGLSNDFPPRGRGRSHAVRGSASLSARRSTPRAQPAVTRSTPVPRLRISQPQSQQGKVQQPVAGRASGEAETKSKELSGEDIDHDIAPICEHPAYGRAASESPNGFSNKSMLRCHCCNENATLYCRSCTKMCQLEMDGNGKADNESPSVFIVGICSFNSKRGSKCLNSHFKYGLHLTSPSGERLPFEMSRLK